MAPTIMFNAQDHLRDMEERLTTLIAESRAEAKDAHKELRDDLESYAASFVVHEQRIIAIERTAATAKKLSWASAAALGGLLLDFVRTKLLHGM